jgi:hypothetical protein
MSGSNDSLVAAITLNGEDNSHSPPHYIYIYILKNLTKVAYCFMIYYHTLFHESKIKSHFHLTHLHICDLLLLTLGD